MLDLAGNDWSIYSHLSTLQGCLMDRSNTAQRISVKLWVLPGLVLVTTPATELITAGLQSHVARAMSAAVGANSTGWPLLF